MGRGAGGSGGREYSGGKKVVGDKMEGRVGVGFWSSTKPSVDATMGPRCLRLRLLKEGRRQLPFLELFRLFVGLFSGELVVSVPAEE